MCVMSVWDASFVWEMPVRKIKFDFYLNDCLDAIEYALGDKTTEWGARRAADGHPKPFPLQYVEIGNENWGDEYDKRFRHFSTRRSKKNIRN